MTGGHLEPDSTSRFQQSSCSSSPRRLVFIHKGWAAVGPTGPPACALSPDWGNSKIQVHGETRAGTAAALAPRDKWPKTLPAGCHQEMVTHRISKAHPHPIRLAQGFLECVQAHSHSVMVVAGALGTEWPFLPQRPLDALLLKFCTALQFSSTGHSLPRKD